MAILQVRDIDDHVYAALKTAARLEKRSLSQEVNMILQTYLANPDQFKRNPTREFLALAGSWDDERSADTIISDIRNQRMNSDRFGAADALFD